MFVACRGALTDSLARKVSEILEKAGIREFKLIVYSNTEEGSWIGICAEECLRYDENAEAEVYEYEECGVKAVEEQLEGLIAALREVAALPEVGVAAITNVPTAWPWGPVRIESSLRKIRIYATFVARDAPKTNLEDGAVRIILFKASLKAVDSLLPFTLVLTPFIVVREFLAKASIRAEETDRGFIFTIAE